MTKILVVFTGGTIGSGINKKGNIDIDKKAKSLLTDMYFSKWGRMVDFDTAEPYYELSENIDAAHWNTLINFFNTVDCSVYDGIILAHGSDTLSYTAAMLSFAMRHIPIPLVLIASNYPLTDERSNGLKNFEAAVTLIKKSYYRKGVYVCYSNDETAAEVFIGSRLIEADHIFDTFRSVDNSYLCKIVDDEIIPNECSLNPSKEAINKEKARLKIGRLKNNVLLLRSYPGQNFDNISLNGISAVLAVGYHSATVCASESAELSFWNFAKRCKDKGIDIYISSFKSQTSYLYESAKGDFVRLCNISPEAAYAKVMLAYSTDNPSDIINSEIYFEEVKF